MRLHRLTLTAFGPFAGTEEVDFDELNEAGLFLLTGPTGAGKSSLLDAVCFALYGTVPGARGTRTLKSQHAPRDTAPEVVLDFTVQGRRFVVRRTPEWSRPKKRGDGELTEKASASIVETTGGTDHFLSSRAAEVGLLVSDLMGMSSPQFMQVALLPQGEFQTFLRATSQQRHDVLQQLFRTDRFARIEDWVNERSRQLRDEAGTGRATVQRILDTVADRVGVPTPEHLAGDLLARSAAEDRVLPWVAGLLETARDDAEACRREDAATRERLDLLRDRHRACARRAELRTRLQAARRTLESLDESEPGAAVTLARLRAAERADRCAPVLALRRQAAAARQRAVADSDLALAALAASPACDVSAHDLTADLVAVALEAARGRLARLEAVLPRERAAADAARRRDADLLLLRTAEREAVRCATRAGHIPAELADRTARLGEAASRANRHESLALALAAAQERHRAAVEVEQVRAETLRLEDAQRAARDRAQDARQHVQDLMARRLAGMAAELAGALADGAPCHVCGSLEHPHPARPADDAVAVTDQEQAELRLVRCSSDLEAATHAVQRLLRRHDTVSAAAGGLCPADASAAVEAAAADLRAAVQARADQRDLEDEIRRLRDEEEQLHSRRLESTASAAALQEAVAGHDRTLAAVADEVAAALGELDAPGRPAAHGSVTAALDEVGDLVSRLSRADRALRDAHEASARHAALVEQTDALARELGFPGVEEVAAATLPRSEQDRLAQVLADRAATRDRATAELESDASVLPQGEEAGSEGVDDVETLARAVAEEEMTAAAAARRGALLDERAARLAQLLDRLGTAMTAWAPLRDEALRAESMSRLVRGMGHDNQLQMRLSAYVLATRLDQVVAAANERLGHMRDQRYLLQRSGRVERRASQAGLGLEIVDQWTGDVRAPTTLSGGETFVVSLSLALGLADVVTQESGGTEVETLFVDEGFGTLDADTLDDVMDRLDGLRAGGRTVGVVSHVSELRSRIPTQVRVEKGRDGSTIGVRTLVG